MLNSEQELKFEYLFRLFDKDYDRRIGLIDILYAFEKLVDNASSEADKDRLHRALSQWWTSLWFFADLIEGNKDREISEGEWNSWARNLSYDVKNNDDSRPFTMWCDAVYDGIGGGDAITAAEYAAWWDSFDIQGDAATNFQKLDTNDDGAITKAEFTALLKEFIIGDLYDAGSFLFGDPNN